MLNTKATFLFWTFIFLFLFELSNKEFKITMSNMLRVLMEKVNNVQKQMCNISRDSNKNENKC
jgi:hypothetical protein